MNSVQLLEKYRDGQLSKSQLYKRLEGCKPQANVVIVDSNHLISRLRAYQAGIIDQHQLVEWVNVIWFSDFYDYNSDECSSIASIMDVLEELDEGDKILTSEQVDYYVVLLENNQEYDPRSRVQ